MTNEETPSTVVVVDERFFEVSVFQRAPRSMLLTVVADGRDQWSFEVAGWRPWSCGVSSGDFYLWSARQLIVFQGSSWDPFKLDFDEDLLIAFKRDPGWVLVCETSVRQVTEQGEVARVEFDEVIELARWRHGCLVVRDVSGLERSITVSAGGLVVEPAS